MPNRDFLSPNEVPYLGIPIRDEVLPIDEIRQGDIFNNTTLATVASDNSSAFYRQIECVVFDPATALSAGDKKIQAVIPFDAILVGAYAKVDTASTSGDIYVTLSNTNLEDILSGNIIVEAGEYSSHLSTLQPKVLTDKKIFPRHSVINVNIDSVGTGTLGLVITLYFVVIQYFDN